MNYIKCENISKVFKVSNKERVALKNINLEFNQNKSYAIMGKSGSGKSTLLSLISAMDNPTSGAVYFNDKNLADLSAKEKEIYFKKTIGLVFQEPNLISELSVIENIMLKKLLNSNKKDIEKAYSLLETIGLNKEMANLSPEILSGGEQQRIAIARAVFDEPVFLIADEPTAHLDEENKILILNLLKNFKSMGIVLATHDPEVAGVMQEVIWL